MTDKSSTGRTTAREALERVKRVPVSPTGLNSPEDAPPPKGDANASIRRASRRNTL
jgi:hypothetical protein